MVGDYFALQAWSRGLEALESFGQAASLLESWEKEKLRAVALRSQGRGTEAEMVLQRIAADPRAPEIEKARAEFDLAWAAVTRGDTQLALELYRGLVGRYGDSTDAPLKSIAHRS